MIAVVPIVRIPMENYETSRGTLLTFTAVSIIGFASSHVSP